MSIKESYMLPGAWLQLSSKSWISQKSIFLAISVLLGLNCQIPRMGNVFSEEDSH